MSQYNNQNEPGKSTGGLFVNDYKEHGDKKPFWTGYLDVTKDQITDLIQKGKEGKDVKLKLSGWVYPSKQNANQERIFVVSDSTEYVKKGDAPAPAPEPKNDWEDDDVPF